MQVILKVYMSSLLNLIRMKFKMKNIESLAISIASINIFVGVYYITLNVLLALSISASLLLFRMSFDN